MKTGNNKSDIIKELSHLYYKRNKKRNWILEFAVILIIFMIFVIFSVVNGRIEVDRIINVRKEGTIASVSLENGTKEQLNRIKKLDYIESAGVEKKFAELNVRDKYISDCIFADEIAFNDLFCAAYADIKGNYPRAETDIMLSVNALKKLQIDTPVLGMEIEANVAFDSGSSRDTFILSGYYTDFSNTAESEPKAFLSKAFLESNNINIFPATNILAKQIDHYNGPAVEKRLYEDIETTDDTQQIVGKSTYTFQVIENLIGGYYNLYLFIIVVLLCGYLVVYNVVSISMDSDIRQMGLLKAIGTTDKQIRKIVRRENIHIFIKGSLIGSLLSSLFVFFVLPLLLSKFLMQGLGTIDNVTIFKPHFLVISIACAYAVLFGGIRLSIKKVEKLSVVESLHHRNVRTSNCKRKNFKGGSRIYSMAWRNITCSYKQFLITVLTIFIGIETAIAFTVIVAGTDKTNEINQLPNFTIGTYITLDDVRASSHYRIDETFIPDQLLKDILKIKDLVNSDISLTEGNYTALDYSEAALQPRFESVRDTEKSNNFATIQIITEDQIAKLEDYIEEKKLQIDMKSLKEGEGTVLVHYHELSQKLEENSLACIGLPINFYVILKDDNIKMGDTKAGILKCSGYIDSADKYFPDLQLASNGSGINYFLVSEKGYAKLWPEKKIFGVSINLDSSIINKESDIEAEINEVILTHNRQQDSIDNDIYYLFTRKASMDASHDYIKAASVVMGIISAILTFLGIINYVNTLITSFVVRSKEFTVLESIGMTTSQLRLMLFLESLYYIIISAALLLSVGLGMIYAMGNIIKKNISYFSYSYPYKVLFMMLAILLLVGGFSTFTVYKSSRNKSIVDKLNEYNE